MDGEIEMIQGACRRRTAPRKKEAELDDDKCAIALMNEKKRRLRGELFELLIAQFRSGAYFLSLDRRRR